MTVTVTTYDLVAGHLRHGVETGAAAIASSLAATRCAKLLGVSVHMSAAPVASESLTITLNSIAGAAYDTLLYTLNLSTASTTDIVWFPDQPLWLVPGDAIDVAFANTNTNTYGVQIKILEEL